MMLSEQFFFLKPGQKNMNYNKLWKTVFLDFGGREISTISEWNTNASELPEAFKLYRLGSNKIPSAENLGLKKSYKRALPLSRTFNDDVLLAVVFSFEQNKLYCAYSNSLIDTVVFCLWGRDTSGLMESLPIDIFDFPIKVNDLPSYAPLPLKKENHQTGTIKKSRFTFELPYRYEVDEFEESDIWRSLQNDFSDLFDEFDGVIASVIENCGEAELKGEFLELKSTWVTKFDCSVKKDSFLLAHPKFIVAVWLFVSGCPGVITNFMTLAFHIHRFIQDFETDDIAIDDFVSKLERNGYRRQFSRLISMHLSSDDSELIEVIRNLCEPPSLNSFLCGGADIFAYFRSHIHEQDEEIIVEGGAELCCLTVAQSDATRKLQSHPFRATDQNWEVGDFAKHTYEKINKLLEDNHGFVVLGHATSEQSVIDMCARQNISNDNRGMSILASNENKNTCGRGMYFFRISEVGDFDQLSRAGGDPNDPKNFEFQSFLYALTRPFQNSNLTSRCSPAVLLFLIDKTEVEDNFKNTITDQLPYLNCSCSRRYGSDFIVKDDSSVVTLGDAIQITETLFNDSSEKFERMNGVALRTGFVDYSIINGFEGYVQDGSQLSSIELNLEALPGYEKPKSKVIPGTKGQKENFKIFDIQNYGNAARLNGDIINWRRKMLSFSITMRFLKVEPYNGPDNQHNEQICHPREWVVTSQAWLCKMFESLKDDGVYVVFVDPDISFTTRPANLMYRYQKPKMGFDVSKVSANSSHPYFQHLRECIFRDCNRKLNIEFSN